MGGPTSDDDPNRRADGPGGPGGWGGPGGPGQGGSQYPGPPSPPPGAYPPPGQGPTYPPPGPGWGPPGPDAPTSRFPQAEEQRGPTARFPQYPPGGPAGPYPPQGPQGPYGYGGPPPDGNRGNRRLVVALVVGLVILVVLGVALVYAFTRDSGDTVSADPSATPGAPPASSPSVEPSPSGSSGAAPSSSTASTGSAASSSTGSGGADRTDELLAVVPPDFTDCAATEPAGDGDVAAVSCGASTTQPGPTSATFYLYDDTATLDEVFAEDAQQIESMPEGQDCSTAQGVTAWNAAGVEGGEIACTITGDGLVIAWTDREFGIEGVVTAPGSTQEELAELADWWRGNSDFQR